MSLDKEVWSKVSPDLGNISQIIDELTQKRELLCKQIVIAQQENSTDNTEEVIMFHKSLNETIKVPIVVYDKYKQTKTLQNLGKYLEIYSRITEGSKLHQKCVETENIEKSIDILEEMNENIVQLKCLELNWIVMDEEISRTISECIELNWNHLSAKINHMINQLNWPYHTEQNCVIDKTKFINLATNYSYLTRIHSVSKQVNKVVYKSPICLLTSQLNIRFVYHFSGDRETNNINKPEWCFKQVLKWIEVNSTIIETELVEVISEKAANEYRNILRDFMGELCRFVVRKVAQSLEEIETFSVSKGVKIFSHWIDEILEFEECLGEFGFVAERGKEESVIEVLQNERNIPKMLEMEQNISDNIQNNFHTNLDKLDADWAINVLIEIKALKNRGDKISHPNYKLQTVGIIQDLLQEVSEKVRVKFNEIQVWRYSMDQVITLLNGVSLLIENVLELQEEAFFLKIASKTKSQENSSQILDDVIMNLSCLRSQIVQSIQTYVTTIILNSANEYTSLDWIQNLPPIDDVILVDIPKPFFHLLDNVNSMMERIANINTTTHTQILLNAFGDLDKKLFENIFLDKFPNSNLFTNISIHLQKYLFTCVNINNTFLRLQDVINIFSKTEVELSLILRDINSQGDWSSNKKHIKEIDVNKKYNISFLDTEEIKFIITQRMNQLSIIPN